MEDLGLCPQQACPFNSPASPGTIAEPFRRSLLLRNATKKPIQASGSAGKNVPWTSSATPPIDQLASRFDLIIVDHPWAGFAFEKNLVCDLKPLLPRAVLDDCARNFIGAAFESYCYAGWLLALPIDAATPTSSYRADLLERAGVSAPVTWSEAVELARRKLPIIPAFNADLFLHFLMLLNALGAVPCSDRETIAPREIMRDAIDLLRELTESMPSKIFEWNPIQVAENMAATDEFAWNAFAYTYNNYARAGFARHRLHFGGLISLKANGRRLRSVLGGTGIAISTHCKCPEVALDYASFLASATVKRTLYLNAGGQPAHCAAWDDKTSDILCGGFFRQTRPAQEKSFIRPRYSGYVPLQTQGGNALQETLRDGRAAEPVLEKLDRLYRESRLAASPVFQSN